MAPVTFKLTLTGGLGASKAKKGRSVAEAGPLGVVPSTLTPERVQLPNKFIHETISAADINLNDRLRRVTEVVANNLSRSHDIHSLRSLQTLSSQIYDIVTPHLFRRAIITTKTAHSLLWIDGDEGVNLWDLPRQMRSVRERGRYFKPESRSLRRMVNWWYINELMVESVPFAKMSEDFLLLALKSCTDCSLSLDVGRKGTGKEELDEDVSILLAMDRNKYRLAPNLTTLIFSYQAVQTFTAYPLPRRSPSTALNHLPRIGIAAANPARNLSQRDWSTRSGDSEQAPDNEPFLKALIYASNPINVYLHLPSKLVSTLWAHDVDPPPILTERQRLMRRERGLPDSTESIRCIGSRLASLLDPGGDNWWSRLRNLCCSSVEMGDLPSFPGVNHTYNLFPVEYPRTWTTTPVGLDGPEDNPIPVLFSVGVEEEPHPRLEQLKTAFLSSVPGLDGHHPHFNTDDSYESTRHMATWRFVFQEAAADEEAHAEIAKLDSQLRAWFTKARDEGGLGVEPALAKAILDRTQFAIADK